MPLDIKPVQQVVYDQTAEAWSHGASMYGDLMRHSSFTRMFAIDCLDKTIPLGNLKPDLKILDIATGTGALSIPAADRVKNTNGHVNATDFSPEMIAYLKKEINAHPTSIPIEPQIMDGQNLEFPENTFDFAYSVFGLIFFPDLRKGVSEIHRVLKPGGKAGIVSWTEQTPMTQNAKETVEKLYKDAGLAMPPQKLTIESLADPIKFEAIYSELGYKNISITKSSHQLKLSIPEYIKLYQTNPVIDILRMDLPEDLNSKFDQTYEEVLIARYPTGNVEIDGVAYIGIAEK